MIQKNQAEENLQQFLETATGKLNQHLETNLTLRMKYPTQTHRFYPSQQAIHQILKQFAQLLDLTDLEAIKLLQLIVSTKICIPLFKVLQHPNADINNGCISVIYSLIVEMGKQIQNQENDKQIKAKDSKSTQQAFACYFRISVWMVQNGLLQNLLIIWSRLDEQAVDEYEGCFKILKIIESLLQLVDTTAAILIKQTKIIEILANRIMPNFKIAHKTIDDNKFVASDILLALLQTPPISQESPQQGVQVYQPISASKQFLKFCGMEILIETISSYENKLPQQIDQRQFLSNLFDCVNVMLVSTKQSRKYFYQLKGNYLMVSYICIKSEYATVALKSISNSLTEGQDIELLTAIANGIVQDGSIKYLFPILMGQGIKGEDIEEQSQINQHILSIVYALVKHCDGLSLSRVLYKLSQKRYGKLQRIFQIRTENRQQNQQNNQEAVTPQQYLKMIKEQRVGIVQICDKMIITLFWKGDKKMKQKILAFMNIYHISGESIKFIIQTHYMFIDVGPEKHYIEKLLAEPLRQLNHAQKIENQNSQKDKK